MVDIDVDAVRTDVVEPEPEDVPGTINITVTDGNIKYDSNLSLPELVFWMDVVHEMIMAKVLGGEG